MARIIRETKHHHVIYSLFIGDGGRKSAKTGMLERRRSKESALVVDKKEIARAHRALALQRERHHNVL